MLLLRDVVDIVAVVMLFLRDVVDIVAFVMLFLRDVVDIVAVVMLFLRDVVDIAVVCGKLSTTKPSNRSLQHHPYLSQPLSRSSQSTLLNSPHSHHSVKFVRPFFTTFSLQDNEPRIASSLRHYNYRNCSKIKEGFLHNP